MAVPLHLRTWVLGLAAALDVCLTAASVVLKVPAGMEPGRPDVFETRVGFPTPPPLGTPFGSERTDVRRKHVGHAIGELDGPAPRQAYRSGPHRSGYNADPSHPSVSVPAPPARRFLAAQRDGTLSSRGTGLPPPA